MRTAPAPFAIVREGGLYQWTYRFPDGGNDEDLTHELQDIAPGTVVRTAPAVDDPRILLEPITSRAIGITERLTAPHGQPATAPATKEHTMNDTLTFGQSLARPKNQCAYCGRRLKFQGGDLAVVFGPMTAIGASRTTHCRACGSEQPERETFIEWTERVELFERIGNWIERLGQRILAFLDRVVPDPEPIVDPAARAEAEEEKRAAEKRAANHGWS